MKSDESGFLLAELTVTLALLVVVLAVGFLFYFFCTRSFADGEKRTLVQSNARLAANFITKEVRYADNIGISDENIPEDKTCYYCLKLGDDKVLQEDIIESDSTTTRTITRDACLSGLSFDLSKDNGKAVLGFTITGNDGTLKNDVEIDSEVLLDNISGSDLPKVEGIPVIYFTKPGG